MNSSIDVRRPQVRAAVSGAQRALSASRGRAAAWAVSCLALVLGAAFTATPAAADSVTRVYQSRMPDGKIVFGDKPAAGAAQTRAQDYRLPEALPAAELAAEEARWAAEARAFEQRHIARAAVQAAESRQRRLDRAIGSVVRAGSPEEQAIYGLGYGPGVNYRPIFAPVGNSVYRSSPGAVNGRGAPFLSSGFMAHPVQP